MRGRDSQTTLISEMLHRGRTVTGGVILVEGGPGMGKSLLLAEAAKAAAAQGYMTVAAAADQFERMIPLCPLLLALGDVADPDDHDHDHDHDHDYDHGELADVEPDPRMRAVAQVRRSLERLAAHGPVIVTVDDLEHADPVTLLALRVLPRRLAVRPVSWLLARTVQPRPQPRPQSHDGAARLFDLLDHDGADRLLLGPLPVAAIAEVITDLLGAPPDAALLDLAAGTGGNPHLVAELLRGLREENKLRREAGTVTMTDEGLPERVRKFFAHQLGSLRPQTRQLIEVSAVLGRSFAVEDAAEMLGQQPAMVLPAISEALASGIIKPDGETLAFRDDVSWRAVAEAMPDSVARALHRQAGRLLLDRGDAHTAARHLVAGARLGDSRVLLELDMAMRKVLPSSAPSAADLAARALELTSPADPARAGRAVSAARALLAARRLGEAARLIETELARPLPAAPRAKLRCARVSVHALSGQPGRARAEAEELLAEPDLPADVRDDATVALLQVLGELPDLAAAEQRAKSVGRLAARLRGADRPSGRVVAAAKALQATVRWNQGHIAAGLDLFREAASEGGAERGRRPYRTILSLAAHLIDVGLVAEAEALLSVPCEDDDAAGLAMAQSGQALLRARMHLAAGRIDAAVSQAQAAIGAAGHPYALLARCMLGTIALRQGDLGAESQLPDWAAGGLAEASDGRTAVLCQVLAAQVAEARDGPKAALSIVGGIYDLIGEVRWPLIHDPGMAPWLVRLALAAGDKKRAARVGAVAAELGRLNPVFPVVTAACAHAQGLLKDDLSALRQAARTQPDTWAAASAATDLAAALTSEARAHEARAHEARAHGARAHEARRNVNDDRKNEAIEWLETAHDKFQATGASRDAARVRGMLRGLGVRRGRKNSRTRATQPRKTAGQGLNGLSEAEQGIAELVCQGLTNRQIAERMFVSVNTVAFHLRNIYRKLRITSRVQLARLVLDSRLPAS